MLSNEKYALATAIDQHINKHLGFAIYKLPYSSEIHLVVQNSGQLFTTHSLSDIDNKEGFVVSPYNLNHQLPIVIISPQHTACGISNVISTINSLPTTEHTLPAPTLPVHNMSKTEYEQTFRKFIQHINNADVDKLVLTRTQSMLKKISVGKIFVESCEQYPRMMIYAMFTPISGTWIGCSPETLVDGGNGKWTTMALAGTKLYDNKHQWDDKNKEEQHVVEAYISHILNNLGAKISVSEPYTMQAAHLMHLRTDFMFTLPQNIGIGTIAAHLHPTPAVCGRPCEAAQNIIETDEATLRLYYSGLVGWISPKGNNHLYVNLRCLMTANDQLTIYAGGGIMKDSDAETEWNETEIKMDTLINLLHAN